MLRLLSTLALLTLIAGVLAACAGVNDSGSHPDFLQTQAANQPDEGDNGHGDGDGEGEATPGAEATEPAGNGGEDLVAIGQELAQTNACLGCHSIDGSDGVGPTWQGLYGHEVTLSDGSTVTADEAYIAEAIRNPGEKVVEGYQNIMPPTFADWTDDQVNAIIAFIQSLE